MVEILESTEKKKFEDDLEESDCYRKLIEFSPDAIAVHCEGKFVYVNGAGLKLIGAENQEQLLGKSVLDILHPDYRESVKERMIQTLRGENNPLIEEKFVRLDGKIIDVEVAGIAITYMNKPAVQVVVRDVTERNKFHKERQTLAHALESINECVTITDENNRIVFVNDAFQQTYGYHSEEVVGKDIDMLLADSGLSKINEKVRESTIAGSWKGELLNKKKNGDVFPIHLSTSVVKGNKGEPFALIGVATDVTELKRSREELIKAKEKAEISDKLKTEFLAQMSHEIRTPINITINYSDIIKEELKENITPELNKYFDGIKSAGERLLRTIELILNVSEMQVGSYQPKWKVLDLGADVFENMLGVYKAQANIKGIKLTLRNELPAALIYADHFSVLQIFNNLIENAIKFTDKGAIEILIQNNIKSELEVIISDTGIGISEDFMNHIFKPFMQEERGYSRSYEGNGIGLFLVKMYCNLNFASVSVTSKKGVGSKFKVTFQNKN